MKYTFYQIYIFEDHIQTKSTYMNCFTTYYRCKCTTSHVQIKGGNPRESIDLLYATFNYVALIQSDMSRRRTVIRLQTDHRRAGVMQRACGRVRVAGSYAARIGDDVAGVARAFICGASSHSTVNYVLFFLLVI